MSEETGRNWQAWWDARVSGIESVLGKADSVVRHAPVPFALGPDAGGAADVISFTHHVPGFVFATSELIGRDDQVPNTLGNYELAICHRSHETWGPNLVSQLAHYTLEVELHPGDTMDIGPATPAGSTIAGLLFMDFGRFTVLDRAAGLLLCIGITADELDACRLGDLERVEVALREKDVFPFTDLFRPSALVPQP